MKETDSLCMKNGFGWIWMDSDLSVAAVLMQKVMINQWMEWGTPIFKQTQHLEKWEEHSFCIQLMNV